MFLYQGLRRVKSVYDLSIKSTLRDLPGKFHLFHARAICCCRCTVIKIEIKSPLSDASRIIRLVVKKKLLFSMVSHRVDF